MGLTGWVVRAASLRDSATQKTAIQKRAPTKREHCERGGHSGMRVKYRVMNNVSLLCDGRWQNEISNIQG